MGATGRATELELLVFDLGGRTYGLPSSEVVEIVRAVTVAPLPTGPRIVSGVINVRGRIVPAFDLRVRFGMPSPPVEPTEHFVVARAGHRMVALRTDRVLKLVKLERTDVIEAERIVSGTRYLAGLAKAADGIVLIQDLDAFLSEAEGATLDRALGASTEAP